MIPDHPFTKTKKQAIAAITIAIIAILTQWGLLVFYGQPILAALYDSTISIILLFILSYLLWYTIGFIRIIQTEIALAMIVMMIWLGGCYISQDFFTQINHIENEAYITTLPIRITFGLLFWIIISQWYHIQRLIIWKDEHILTEQMQALQEEDKITDRIVVKDRTHIHIIQLDDLIYIQACGDYITLVSPNGKYLKEQTMKHLEAHLPEEQFVRIHRSYIVNIEHILRIEPYGKETYTVLLKNGVQLRASNNGYKLLKERLSL